MGITNRVAPKLEEGTKDDGGKPRYDLLSTEWLNGTTEILTFGVEKYEEWNWAKGIKYSRVFSALMRHLWAWWMGEKLDEETGKHHLWHASCCLMFLVHYEAYPDAYFEYDDRFKRE
jgi:hypothetical protein